MLRIDDLIANVQGYAPPGADLEVFNKAFVYSAQLHRNRFSRAGQPVVQHSLEVSNILADFRLDIPCVVAGLFHDVLEEELANPASLREMVGPDVAGLVEELSRLSRATFQGSVATRAEHMRQMILATTRDLRVILILLADRLQTLRDPSALTEEALLGLARETLAIYAPIAHRLGIHFFKAEMEDLAFRILEPTAYLDLQKGVDKRVSQRKVRVEQIKQDLAELLEIHGIQGEVLGRTKNLYSVFTKMRRDQLSLDRVYDLLATRVTVQRTEDCYRLLGLIHAAYTPLPGKFKDYIALPKPNGYQSLHTCVFGAEGDIFEIQIRTTEMHRKAEFGIAAHFSYKDGEMADENELANVSWFRQLVQNLEKGEDAQESMDNLTAALQLDEIFVLTPAGEVIKLPKGATPIDFAYAIHSGVGHKCTGAKMDGRMVSIRTPLENAAVVEIITSGRQTPKKDWLNYAVTSKALSRIRSFLRAQENQAAIALGREQVAREAKRVFKKPGSLVKNELVVEWMRRNGMSTPDEFFAAVGNGRVVLKELLERLFPDPLEAEKPSPARAAPPSRKTPPQQPVGVRIAGLDNVAVRFAKCCSPGQGAAIKGIVTRGRGVSIHRPNCHNISEAAVLEGRVVEAEWTGAASPRAVNLALRAVLPPADFAALIARLEREVGAAITLGRATTKRGVRIQHLSVVSDQPGITDQLLARLNAAEGIHAVGVLESA